MEEFISIIVCTYNRGNILIDCLNALCNQTAPQSSYEIIIVDNNSTDDTKKISEDFCSRYSNIRYVVETKQGLSNARNCGYLNSKSDWVGYMDDDGKANANYIEESFKVINNYDFDCFGGRYTAWYENHQPKWLDDNFGCSKVFSNEIVELDEKYYNSGGIIFFKKSVLVEMGGFDASLGMTGGKLGYGEETHLQIKMREKGMKIGYSPFVSMEHLVAEIKLKWFWHIKAYFSHGKSNRNVWGRTPPGLLVTLKKSVVSYVKIFPRSVFKFLSRKEYYIQNVLLDTYRPIAYFWGEYAAGKS